MKQMLLATTNQGKIKEVRRLLSGLQVDLVGLEPEETTAEIEVADTYEANARLKAEHYFRKTGLPTIADDSGLEVDAIDGAPGVYSARYGGEGLNDRDRLEKLLEEMRGVGSEKRGAQFVCAAAIASGLGTRIIVRKVRGEILTEPRGTGGFGYDPVFYYGPLRRTFAELDAAEKESVSHRGLAFVAVREWLPVSGLLDTPKSDDRMAFPF